ncbi:hypothetical protein N8J89_07885 [Crossiella sp. CA-258035]|uniref:hypothetical protein n=1 Tax=Crossiella sp. CA-258035 TaxID=2981138 RepID=UPI0024BC6D0D|nr:hypothetical protein [Crossiella sp. CA-258035]WHT20974.1 hypothetical protein N8J89_07885 [Crossiella sp. CA-258035]
MSQKDIALAMVVLKHLMDVASKSQTSLRQHASDELDVSDRVSAKSPVDGTLLGTITKSKPKPKVVVSNRFALIVWLEDNYPDRVVVTKTVNPANLAELVPQLEALGLGDYVDTEYEVSSYTLAEITKLSEKAGRPVGPGGELDIPGVRVDFPDGTVSVRLEPDVHHAIVDVIKSGHVALDGTVRPELPGGGE